MSFIRPEVRRAISRWSGALAGGAVLALGLYWLALGQGIMPYIGGALVIGGAALLWDGVRRARFPAAGGGPGVVEIDERRITYWGPDGGTAMSLNDVARIMVHTSDQGPFLSDTYWEFTERSGLRLVFPGDAEGTGGIFDALATFEGVDYDAVLKASASVKNASFTVWEDEPVRLR